MTSVATSKTGSPTSMDSSILPRLLDEGYGPGSWHGADLRAAVADVSDTTAFWRPGAGRHNIAEIALHHALLRAFGDRTAHPGRIRETSQSRAAIGSSCREARCRGKRFAHRLRERSSGWRALSPTSHRALSSHRSTGRSNSTSSSASPVMRSTTPGRFNSSK